MHDSDLGPVALIDFRLISGIRWSGGGVIGGVYVRGNPGISVITPLRKDPIGGHPLRWWSGGGSVASVESVENTLYN